MLPLQAVHDVAQGGLGGQFHRGVGQAHAGGAAAHLFDSFLAGDVGAFDAAQGRLGDHLQHQGRLAHAGIAADQDGAAGDHAAATDPVELVDAGGDAGRGRGLALQALKRQAAGLGGFGGR